MGYKGNQSLEVGDPNISLQNIHPFIPVRHL